MEWRKQERTLRMPWNWSYQCELMIAEIKHGVYISTREMFMVRSYLFICIEAHFLILSAEWASKQMTPSNQI